MKINRTIAPPLEAIAKPDLQQAEKFILKNGIPVYSLRAGTQEVCKIDFVFEAGIWQQTKPLLAALTNAMLQEGTASYSAVQLAETFDFYGAYLQLTADYHYATISVITLEKHLEKLLPIVEELIKHSTFPVSEFDSLIQRRKQRFLLEMEKAKILCQKKFTEVLFGRNHPYALGLKAEDFGQAELTDFKEFYRHYYHSGNCEIHLTGQYQDEVFDRLNDYFGNDDWKGKKDIVPYHETVSANQQHFRVIKEDSIQSAIRIGKLLVPKDHEDYFGLQILTTILGGYFSSRLMLNIREEKGYTYGIGAHFVSLNQAGYLIIATEVDKAYEEDTLTEIRKEIELLQTAAVSNEELERVKQYLTGEFLREFDGPFSLSQAFRNIHDFGLDYTFYNKYYQTIHMITSEELQRLAQLYFNPGSFYTVIAGK